MLPPVDAIRRVAVVTGSNQGIGYFIALQLALSGKFQDVVLACRNEARGLEAVASMKPYLRAENANLDVRLSYEHLELGNTNSHQRFAQQMEENFGKVDCLVNNAAMAFKGADPTPFADQCTPTLDVNFRGTVDFTECMMPLLRKGTDARLVSLSSSTAILGQVSPALQRKFTDPDLTMNGLRKLVDEFEKDVSDGVHRENGWSNSNYGFSKLAVTAATRIWARDEAANGIAVNCCDPGYCSTSMTSHKGPIPPQDGARNAVIPATVDYPPTGEIYQNCKVVPWHKLNMDAT